MKRKFLWRCLNLLILPTLLLGLSAPALAAEKTGSISVTMADKDGTPIPGGELKLYMVAESAVDDGNKFFVPAAGFEAFEEELLALDPEGGLRELDPEQYASHAKNLTGVIAKVDTNGQATFPGLEEGAYLIVQNKPAKGYLPISPFFVTVPFRDPDGNLIYHVNAGPKAEPGVPAPPTKPTEPSDTKPPSGKLPQTGVLWWPVPLLALAGLVLLSAGYVLNQRNRHGK